jgi:hypothetical protein
LLAGPGCHEYWLWLGGHVTHLLSRWAVWLQRPGWRWIVRVVLLVLALLLAHARDRHMVAAPALHPAGGDRGISWPGTARHSLLERQYYHRQAANGAARGTWASRIRPGDSRANKTRSRVRGRFCGGRPLSLAVGDASREDAHAGVGCGCPMILAGSARVLVWARQLSARCPAQHAVDHYINGEAKPFAGIASDQLSGVGSN